MCQINENKLKNEDFEKYLYASVQLCGVIGHVYVTDRILNKQNKEKEQSNNSK